MKRTKMTKEELSDEINKILGLSPEKHIDFTPMRADDLKTLLNVLNEKPKGAHTERTRLLARRPVRTLLKQVLTTSRLP